ncbi:MAG: hypothetical protein QOJ71_750, partial [Actinomycetota bacterium]|nr:hypothetical protein [Actinomycetota bacterium]
RTGGVVIASTEVDVDQPTAFRAFSEADVYARWLGVPVTIDDGRFACTMEFGTRVRGRYEVMCAPELIAFRWDFADDNVPVPGGEMTGYLRFHALAGEEAGHCRIEVQQLVDTAAQEEFMEVAWTMVLGRCRAGVVGATNPAVPVKSRRPRPKRRTA